MTTTTTKERPILFNGEMVRAILSGQKTQTRRVVKLRDPSETYSVHDDDGWPYSADDAGDWHRDPCPYGVPGDRLWVRETWQPYEHADLGTCVRYRADGECVKPDWPQDNDYWAGHWCESCANAIDKHTWHPSIHMFRWACRLVLTVTDVRVERLQDISSFDAMNEGVASLPIEAWSAVGAFRQLWDSINASRGFGWDTNPWVWVVSFQREGGAS